MNVTISRPPMLDEAARHHDLLRTALPTWPAAKANLAAPNR